MNDGVSVREKSFATRLEALDHYDTLRTQESFPDMARRAVKSCLPKYGVHDSRGAADKLVPVPGGLDDSAAATSYINPLTAWALTRSAHNLKEGDWLLQSGAASSVGKLVLQLAQQFRFKTINVIRRREQETIIRNLAGNEVICTARPRLQELTAGKGVERAID
jgi:NADPH:quinone reductase-like Zn-dependent oxidoreductase